MDFPLLNGQHFQEIETIRCDIDDGLNGFFKLSLVFVKSFHYALINVIIKNIIYYSVYYINNILIFKVYISEKYGFS